MAVDADALRLARRVRGLRMGAGLTQSALASALSQETPVGSATVSSWESTTHPTTPPDACLDAYARFFAINRSYPAPPAKLITAAELTAEEVDQYHGVRDELFGLYEAGQASEPEPEPEPDPGRRILLDFEAGDVTIVCPDAPKDEQGPLADQTSPNFSRLHGFAEADALIELFGHIRAFNPDADVFYRTPSRLPRGELQYHLILVGGVGWNAMTKRILDRLRRFPIEQVEDPRVTAGDIFQLKRGGGLEERSFLPVTDDETGELVEDVALIARLPNPFNYGRTVTICNGIHSRGVVGAVVALTDETIRPGNEAYLAERFPASRSFAMLVRVPVVAGDALAPDLQNPDARLFEWDPSETELS